MKILAKVGASTRLYMKKFHNSQRDPNPSRRVNPSLEKGFTARRVDPGWLLWLCKYLLQVDRRRVDPLRRVEANPGSCKGGLRPFRSAKLPYSLRAASLGHFSCLLAIVTDVTAAGRQVVSFAQYHPFVS